MNLDGRWCDLSVRDFLVVERVWNWTTGLLQLAIISGGAFVVRALWKRRRAQKVKTWAESAEASQPVAPTAPPRLMNDACWKCGHLRGLHDDQQLYPQSERGCLAEVTNGECTCINFCEPPMYKEPPAQEMEHCPICAGLGFVSPRQLQAFLEDQCEAAKSRARKQAP